MPKAELRILRLIQPEVRVDAKRFQPLHQPGRLVQIAQVLGHKALPACLPPQHLHQGPRAVRIVQNKVFQVWILGRMLQPG